MCEWMIGKTHSCVPYEEEGNEAGAQGFRVQNRVRDTRI
jgi:hypothetical protein